MSTSTDSSNDGGPAFPVPPGATTFTGDSRDGAGYEASQPGMSLRDYFASRLIADYANVCQVMVSGGCPTEAIQQEFAKEAYRVADAMLAARTQP